MYSALQAEHLMFHAGPDAGKRPVTGSLSRGAPCVNRSYDVNCSDLPVFILQN